MGKISKRANSEKLSRKEKQELRKENAKLQEQVKSVSSEMQPIQKTIEKAHIKINGSTFNNNLSDSILDCFTNHRCDILSHCCLCVRQNSHSINFFRS